MKNPPKISQIFRQMLPSSARVSYPDADHIDLRRVGRLPGRIPERNLDPPILRIGWPTSWPADGCPEDWPLYKEQEHGGDDKLT
jgi:hypothetical protein